MQDWAEVHRLHHRRRGIEGGDRLARRDGRNTVDRLLALREPPRYSRPTQLPARPFADRIVGQLATDPTVRATVVRERLPDRRIPRRDHDPGRTTSPGSARRPSPPARYPQTSYRPGEIGQVDWWHAGAQGAGRPGSYVRAVRAGDDAAVLGRPRDHVHIVSDDGDLRPALLGCLERLGGVPENLVFDNDASVIAAGTGSRARLHDEVAGLLGALRTKPVVLRPARPTSKGSAVNRLGAAKRAGRLGDELERLGRIPLLIVDEVGYISCDPEPRRCSSP